MIVSKFNIKNKYIIINFQQTKSKTWACKLGLRSPKDEDMDEEVGKLEELALLMGFQHEDIIMFENLTERETRQALVYG